MRSRARQGPEPNRKGGVSRVSGDTGMTLRDFVVRVSPHQFEQLKITYEQEMGF